MTPKSSCRQVRICLLALPLLSLSPLLAPGQNSLFAGKRSITTENVIGMTRLEDPDYLSPNPGQAVRFSPDGKRFVLVLKKGNLEQNTNCFSLPTYRSADALHAPKPDSLLKMSSSSDRDAISQIRWLADSDTLTFLGENPGEVSQLYSFQISTKTLKKLTNQLTTIVSYDVTGDGSAIAFIAEPPAPKIADKEQGHSREVVIEGQYLDQILEGDYSLPEGQKVFWQMAGSSPRSVPVGRGYFPGWGPIFLSPDGRYLVFSTDLGSNRMQPEWAAHRDEHLEQMFASNIFKNTPSGLQQYLLFDSQNMSSPRFFNTPTVSVHTFSW